LKQKYVLTKRNDENKLVISEFAELDKGGLSFLCEECYDRQQIETAMEKGKVSLISSLRTENMFPCGQFADLLAESVMTLYRSENQQPMEIFFNDVDLLKKDPQPIDIIDEEAVVIDELLDDKLDEDFDDGPALGSISSPLKIADDETLDIGKEE